MTNGEILAYLVHAALIHFCLTGLQPVRLLHAANTSDEGFQIRMA